MGSLGALGLVNGGTGIGQWQHWEHQDWSMGALRALGLVNGGTGSSGIGQWEHWGGGSLGGVTGVTGGGGLAPSVTWLHLPHSDP